MNQKKKLVGMTAGIAAITAMLLVMPMVFAATYTFKIESGCSTELSGQIYDVDDVLFRWDNDELEVKLDGDWYVVDDGSYFGNQNPPTVITMTESVVCSWGASGPVCSGGSCGA